MKKFTEKIARFIERHPLWFIIMAVIISAAAVPGITMLESETGFSALISSEDKISVDTARYQEEFGGDAINILLTGDIDDIFSTENLEALASFENKVMTDPQYRSVTSPLTVINMMLEEVQAQAQEFQTQLTLAQDQAAQEASEAAAAAGLDEAQQEAAAQQAVRAVVEKLQPQIDAFAQMGEPSLKNSAFIQMALYDDDGGINEALQQFIPDENHVLVFAVPEGNLNDDATLEVTLKIEDFLADSEFKNVDTSVVSFIEMVEAIGTSLSSNLILLLGLSVAVMILILVFMFRVRWRLISLGMVGISALWTFGLMGYIGVPLTMTSMAILPILIGLGIDFSIQFQNRYQEELTRSDDVREAIVTSISRMFPVVGIALVATIIGFITLFISEVPMIKDFGLMLAIGIVICYIVGLFLLHSIILLADRNIPMEKLQTSAKKASRTIEGVLLKLGRLVIKNTVWILIIAIGFAVTGGVVDRMIEVNTDYEKLMPQDNEALVELQGFREIVGVAGSITFMVEAEKIDSPEVLSWMNDFQRETMRNHDDISGSNSPATIITNMTSGTVPSQPEINAILASIPAFSTERILSADRTMAGISFTVKYSDVERIHDLIADIKDTADPPDGVTVSPVGSMVIGAKTMDAIVGSRMKMNLICIAAIFLILLLIYRRLDRTLFSVIPVGAVIAWSSLDMYLIGIPLNPLTAILGVIVIGICTEFMVLLTGRYEEEKEQGLAPADAMATAISRIGRAITTTALTTLGGFGILMVSDFPLISQFGLATLLGVVLCLIITLTVMPGIIVWYDKLRLRQQQKKSS